MFIINLIRGFFMALADSVPGVSGGTIAFILGFYDDFINSLNSLMSRDSMDGKKNSLFFLFKLGIKLIINKISPQNYVNYCHKKYFKTNNKIKQ